VQIHAQSASVVLAAHAGPWDLVFVDPPFEAGLWAEALPALVPRLAPRARVYVESPAGATPTVPSTWVLQREIATREVRAALYKVEQG
jgi:16S rRNA (guanine966-N2)-methyltransferase